MENELKGISCLEKYIYILAGAEQFGADMDIYLEGPKTSVRELTYNNKKIIYEQGENELGNTRYVDVPGFKVSDEFTTVEGLKAVKINPIKDETEKKEIREILEKIAVEVNINFWK